MSESLREVILVDDETGERTSYGALAQQRQVGKWTLTLCYDETAHMWWVIYQASDRNTSVSGYIEARRELCWEDFMDVDEQRLDEIYEIDRTELRHGS